VQEKNEEEKKDRRYRSVNKSEKTTRVGSLTVSERTRECKKKRGRSRDIPRVVGKRDRWVISQKNV